MTTDKQSLYQRIGGKDAVNAAVGVFYEKVLEDESIKDYFANADMKIQI